MSTNPKPHGYWKDVNRCIQSAKPYNTINEWRFAERGAYASALKHGWVVDCSRHMEKIGSHHMRIIYVFEFSDNSAYIGLTYRPNARKLAHFSDPNSAVYQHIKQTGEVPTFRLLTNFLSKEDAGIEEINNIQYYKVNGWTLLNRSKGGGLGGGAILKWTLKACMLDALRFEKRSDWQNHSVAYSAALKRGWVDQCCSHMKTIKKYWSIEKCKVDALKYSTRNEWKLKSSGYKAAFRKGWLESCCSHMPKHAQRI